MTGQPGTQPTVCPFLGLPDDPQSHFSFPEQAHHCRAKDRPARIDLAHQAGFCLGSNYPRCGRFGSRTHPVPVPPIGISVALASTTPEEAAPEPKRGRNRSALLGIVFGLVVVAGMAVIAALLLYGQSLLPSGAATPAATEVALISTPTPQTPTAPPTPQPTAAPTISPSPAPTPSPTPAPTPTPTRAPSPTPQVTPNPTPLIHVVEAGETLRGIANLYGVSWTAIAEVNEIEDPNRIRIGWELIIPLP